MSKVFEDLFMEIQEDMIVAGLDFVDEVADKIYIYGSQEGRLSVGDCFFEVNGDVYTRTELKELSDDYYACDKKETICIRTLTNDVSKMDDLCKEYDRPMPTEIKMVYDVKKGSLSVDYKYELVYMNKKDLYANDIVEQWYNEVKQSLSK